jgi:hypothetical protein
VAAAVAVTVTVAAASGPAAHPATEKPAVNDMAAVSPAAAQAPAGGCSYHPIGGGYQWVCTNITNTGGTQPAGQGGGSKPTCTLTPLSQQQASYLRLQWPAPQGQTWEAITCPGNQPFGGVVLAGGKAAAPAVTPQELAQIAIGDLNIPQLGVQTVPPPGKDGLVGLPEWFWVPGWNAVQTQRVQAGPVWAVATATPESIVISPGPGLPPVSCPGPGTPYNSALSPGAQQTDCSYTYQQPSAGQPGNAYAATVTVLWNVSWTGSGGTGGTVVTGRPVSTPLTLPIAAGEALVTGQ